MNFIKREYSVVLCSYNKIEYLKKTSNKIKSLPWSTELILSDDLSTDGTIEWAKSSGLFDKIHCEKFPGSYRLNTIRNEGTKLASKDYIILLDCDCLPDDFYFIGHDIIFALNPDAISVGITRMYDRFGENMINDDRRLDFFNLSYCCIFDWNMCYGGNMAYSKSLWEKIGCFDESYNGEWGYEDMDFGKHAMDLGYKILSCKLASVRHLEHSISKHASEAKLGLKFKNRQLFESKYKIKFFDK